MIPIKITHVGFSDESNWNVGRFRSLGLITTPLCYMEELENRLSNILEESGLEEFKWKKLKNARERFAAEKLCKFVIEQALSNHLRVDVLVWDIQDRRHTVVGRDDIANLQRMYYHLFRNTLRLRWPDNAVWRLYPDEHTAIDWETIRDCLDHVSSHVEIEQSLLTIGKFKLRLKNEFGLEDIVSARSSDHALLQVADLFAGMAVFSKEKYDEYKAWLKSNSPQLSLLKEEVHENWSNSDRERFRVLKAFDDTCKENKLGVSLNTKRGLWTPDPKNPINFWIYEPQHPEDKAPVKERRL
jgi:hypothetical protein